MSTHSLSFNDSNVGSEVVSLVKQQQIFTISESNTQNETVTASGAQPFGDSNLGVERLCFRVIRQMLVSDSNVGVEGNHPSFGNPYRVNNPPTLGGPPGIAILPQTKLLLSSDMNQGVETIVWHKNGILVEDLPCS